MKRPVAFFPLALLITLFGSISVSAQHADDWNQPVKPFRIVGNIYYVGTNDLAFYLITSPTGHILLDSGEQKSPPLVKASIQSLGFKLKDIKIIITSHGHFDHVGGLAEMKEATGAQLFVSVGDTPVIEAAAPRRSFHLVTIHP